MEKTEARGDGKRKEKGGRKKENNGGWGERRQLLQKEASQVVALSLNVTIGQKRELS